MTVGTTTPVIASIGQSPMALLESLPLGLCLFGPDGLLLFANALARRLWQGEPTLDALAATGSAALLLAQLARGETPRGHDLHRRHGAGGLRQVLRIETNARHTEHGTFDGATVTLADVTAQRPAPLEREALNALPMAVYITDAEGWITAYNPAAAQLWGTSPTPGQARYCGSASLFWPDGTPMRLDQTAMAIALRERRAINGDEGMLRRPDGSITHFLPFPSPIFDAQGQLTGGVNMLVDLTDQRLAGDASQRLAAVVESSDDAILTKDLDGIIATWNRGAERLFGYTSEEAVGRPVTILIPHDRLAEEADIISRIRQGKTIDHFETTRLRKDGSPIEISLTVSPVRNAWGQIAGASKIARDITDRRRADERQKLLLREMHHRIKNLFSLTSGVVALSTGFASSPAALATAVQARLNALARAHELTLPSPGTRIAEQATTLHALVRTVFAAYEHGSIAGRVTVNGDDAEVTATSVTALALMLHEFATNAAKYGALSTAQGHVEVDCHALGDTLVFTWHEKGGPALSGPPASEGFGTFLAQATVGEQLDGTIARDWHPTGLLITVTLERDRLLG